MRVVRAQADDFRAWLDLAVEVEDLFGPMVNDAQFHSALREDIERGAAWCVREGDGPPGVPLAGGILFHARPPEYRIGWLSVAGKWRRQGVGTLLVKHLLSLVEPPAEVIVKTFQEGVEAGRPARQFYEKLGFRPAEQVAVGPGRQPCQVFRLTL